MIRLKTAGGEITISDGVVTGDDKGNVKIAKEIAKSPDTLYPSASQDMRIALALVDNMAALIVENTEEYDSQRVY